MFLALLTPRGKELLFTGACGPCRMGVTHGLGLGPHSCPLGPGRQTLPTEAQPSGEETPAVFSQELVEGT